MIKYLENFDNVASRDVLALRGWSPSQGSYWGQYGDDILDFNLVAGAGVGGSHAMRIGTLWADWRVFTPTIPRYCSKLTFGTIVRPVSAGAYNLRLVFYSGSYLNFQVQLVFASTGGCVVNMTTGTSGYPVIPPSARASVPFAPYEYTQVEVMVDVTNYVNGRCLVVVNGKVISDAYPILTAAGDGFGNNPYDNRSKLNRVGISETKCYHDCIYMADEEGSYHDGPFYDFAVKTIFPTQNGDVSSWTPHVNGIVNETVPQYTVVDTEAVSITNEQEFLQADQDLVTQLLSYPVSMVPNEDIHAVSHQSLMRAVASPGNPRLCSLVPAFKAIGNPTTVVDSKRLVAAAGWAYRWLDAIYGIVPIWAVPWTRLLLEESQFGFLLKEPTWTTFLGEDMGIADEAIDGDEA